MERGLERERVERLMEAMLIAIRDNYVRGPEDDPG
jgi:hypothetical protein